MGYRREVAPRELPDGENLTAAMVGIGMMFWGDSADLPNIEDTLIAASREMMEHGDLRVGSVLVTWLSVHGSWVNVDRMVRALETMKSERGRAFWAAVGQWLSKDRRWSRLSSLYNRPRVDLLSVGTDFQIQRRGEDPRFEGGPLRVPAGVLRDRRGDVMEPSDLARRHPTYRCRVLMGPTYRADMWAQLERDPSLSAAELAHRTYGSFATAWQVKRAWDVLAAA